MLLEANRYPLKKVINDQISAVWMKQTVVEVSFFFLFFWVKLLKK